MPGQRGRGGPPRHYLSLLHYLAARPADQVVVTVTFAELAGLLGAPLSVSARTMMNYWTASSVARSNWERDGWMARLDRLDRAVVFTRR